MPEINVLVVEDKKESAQTLERVLREVGYKVWLVSSGREAIELLKNNIFAAVLTELRMPHMNGVEITRQVRRLSPLTSVVVITAYAFISSAIEAMEEGAYGYITKPFNSSEIRLVMERAVERFYLLSSDTEKDHYVELSVVDGLTGVYNHRFFKHLLSREVTRIRRTPERISLLMIDIDDFKKYNDTYGHPAGDELLKKASQIFKDCLRETDTVCRYGGEEFSIVLSQTDKQGAAAVAKRILTTINLYLPTSVSIGIATYPDDASNDADLVSKADTALYKAKHTGKNRYCAA
jgi:diguanylate cyclase (GGDEF)-like protein